MARSQQDAAFHELACIMRHHVEGLSDVLKVFGSGRWELRFRGGDRHGRTVWRIDYVTFKDRPVDDRHRQ